VFYQERRYMRKLFEPVFLSNYDGEARYCYSLGNKKSILSGWFMVVVFVGCLIWWIGRRR